MLLTIGAGLTSAAVYLIVAIGYNFTYLFSSVFNFAFAYILMLGTFIAYSTASAGWPLWLAMPTGAALGLAVGVVEEQIAISPVLNRRNDSGATSQAELITTVGFATVIVGIVLRWWGTNPLSVPSIFSSSFLFPGSMRITVGNAAAIGLVAVLVVALGIANRRSRIGLMSLAQSEDREAAMLLGVDVRRLSLLGFGVAGCLAVVLGYIIGPATFASWDLGPTLAVKGFVVLALGGVGSYSGIVVAAVTIGVLEAFSAYFWSAPVADLVVFGCLLATLAIRPRGLFGRRLGRAV